MNCLCCNKEINIEESKLNAGWHKRCIKSFFGTDVLPAVECNDDILKKLARDTINKGFTVPGVQKKLSLHLSKISNRDARLTLIDYPAGYIMKPQSDIYDSLPELEFITMKMAEKTGIDVVPNAIVETEMGVYSYITKRIDREKGMFAMEDFCQLSERLTEDKYKGSYEKCGDIISEYSIRPGIDKVEFFIRLLFCFVTGNSDMHLKNFSLIEQKEGNREYVLSKAYDLLPVNIVLPEDKDETALTLNGKKSNLKRVDFEKIGENLGIGAKTVDKLISRFAQNKPMYFEIIESSPLNPKLKDLYMDLIEERILRLSNLKMQKK